MPSTAYQFVKLGSNLEYLRGIATVSLMQSASLAGCRNLLNNLSPRRYSVVNVVNAAKSLLVQLEELGLAESLRAAAPLSAMLAQMEEYLSQEARPQEALLTDPFAERLAALAVKIATAVRTELGLAGARA